MSRLQEERIKNNLSQRELAEKTGIARRTIQEYERGERSIKGASFIVVYNLSKVLNVPMEELAEI